MVNCTPSVTYTELHSHPSMKSADEHTEQGLIIRISFWDDYCLCLGLYLPWEGSFQQNKPFHRSVGSLIILTAPILCRSSWEPLASTSTHTFFQLYWVEGFTVTCSPIPIKVTLTFQLLEKDWLWLRSQESTVVSPGVTSMYKCCPEPEEHFKQCEFYTSWQ